MVVPLRRISVLPLERAIGWGAIGLKKDVVVSEVGRVPMRGGIRVIQSCVQGRVKLVRTSGRNYISCSAVIS